MNTSQLRSFFEENSRELILAILFGSRADGTHRKDSDYDIALLTTSKESFEELEDLLEIKTQNSLDLIHLNEIADNLLLYNIYSKGICLFEKEKGLFDKHYTDVVFNYLDFKPLYNIEEEIVNKKMEKL